jgi:hypothetical protein
MEVAKLQKTIALSTAEAEYCSASTAAVEVVYLRYLLKNMKFAPPTWTPVYVDNNACIEWSNNVIGARERAKRIGIRKHSAHAAVRNGHLRLVRVDTSNQLADVFVHHGTSPRTDGGVPFVDSRRKAGSFVRDADPHEGGVPAERVYKSSRVGPYEG